MLERGVQVQELTPWECKRTDNTYQGEPEMDHYGSLNGNTLHGPSAQAILVHNALCQLPASFRAIAAA